MALASTAVAEVAEIEILLRKTASGDQLLFEDLINTASIMIENEINDFVIQRARSEDHNGGINPTRRGGAKRLYLHKSINTITSITDDASNTIAAADYTIVAPNILEHDALWPAPTGRWTIAYSAGLYAAIANVERPIKQACAQLVSLLLTKQTPGVRRKRVGELEIEYQDASSMEGSLPPMVQALLSPYRLYAI